MVCGCWLLVSFVVCWKFIGVVVLLLLLDYYCECLLVGLTCVYCLPAVICGLWLLLLPVGV